MKFAKAALVLAVIFAGFAIYHILTGNVALGAGVALIAALNFREALPLFHRGDGRKDADDPKEPR